MSMELDMSQFMQAFRQYVLVCKRSLTEIINKKMLFIARGAWRDTPKASRDDIEESLGVSGFNVSRSKKTGQFKRRKAIFGSESVVFKIINARAGRAGKKGLYGKAMASAVQRELNSRIRAIGSLAAGWIKPIRRLAAALKEAAGVEGGPRVRNAGSARPAVDGWNPVAEITYEVTKDGKIDPRVVTALQNSFNREAASMEEYTARKMQQVTDPFNAR